MNIAMLVPRMRLARYTRGVKAENNSMTRITLDRQLLLSAFTTDIIRYITNLARNLGSETVSATCGLLFYQIH